MPVSQADSTTSLVPNKSRPAASSAVRIPSLPSLPIPLLAPARPSPAQQWIHKAGWVILTLSACTDTFDFYDSSLFLVITGLNLSEIIEEESVRCDVQDRGPISSF